MAFLIVAVVLTIGISAYYSTYSKKTSLDKITETKEFALFEVKIKLMTSHFYPRIVYPEMTDFLKALRFSGDDEQTVEATSTGEATVKQLLSLIELSRNPYSTSTDVVVALREIAIEYPELNGAVQNLFDKKSYLYTSPTILKYLLLQKLEEKSGSNFIEGIISFDPDTLTTQTYGQYLQVISLIDERFSVYLVDKQAFDSIFTFAREGVLSSSFEKKVTRNKKEACAEPEMLILGQLANAFAKTNNSSKISICNAEAGSYAVFLPLMTGVPGEPIDYWCFGTIPNLGTSMMLSYNNAYRQDPSKPFCTYVTGTTTKETSGSTR